MLVALVFFPLLALAAETEKKEEAPVGISIETQVVGNTRPSKTDAWYESPVKGSLGLFGSAGRWLDGYQFVCGGPTWKPISWLKVGLGFGAEQAALGEGRNIFFRGAGFLEVSVGKFNAFALFEQGGTGPWHKATVDYQIIDKISLGVMSETNVGIGPRIGYNLGKGYKVWGAVARDRDDRSYTPIFAINYSF
ncbi:MAG: hypothetical protein V1711_01405 [bacterium]